MGLAQRLMTDMKQAMKDRDKPRLSVIRMVRAALKNREIETGTSLTEDDVLAVLQKELKQRRDSLLAFESASRIDLADEARCELEILESYLPTQLSEDTLLVLAKTIIAELGASSQSDMGRVMAVLMPRIRGQADGKIAQKMVHSLLQ